MQDYLPLLLTLGFLLSFFILANPTKSSLFLMLLSLSGHSLYLFYGLSSLLTPFSLPLIFEVSHSSSLFSIDFYFDHLSSYFFIIISVVGFLISIFAYNYFKDFSSLKKCLGLLQLFAMSMLGMVCSDNLLLLFIFWEGTTIVSYLLISFKGEDEGARKAALQALLITAVGGLCLLAAVIMMGQVSQSYRISELLNQLDRLQDSTLFVPITLLVLIAGMTKSAQYPFHFWLPGAMKAPTPVSAYLHSATMVKAGLFLWLRMFPLFQGQPVFQTVLIVLGVATAVWPLLVSFFFNDMKQILAYTTVSALGIMTILIGVGTPLAIAAAILFLLAHALYKSGLFISLGYLEALYGHRDISAMKDLKTKNIYFSLALGLLLLSMMGAPPTIGFIAKETIYDSLLQSNRVALMGIFLASLLSLAVAFRFADIIFRSEFSSDMSTDKKNVSLLAASSRMIYFEPTVLCFLSLILALPWINTWIGEQWLVPVIEAVLAQSLDFKMTLWHGFNFVLFLSLFTFIVGFVFKTYALSFFSAEKGQLLFLISFEKYFFIGLEKLISFAKKQTSVFFVQRLHQAALFISFFVVAFLISILAVYQPLFQIQMDSLFSLVGHDSLSLMLVVFSAFLTLKARNTFGAIIAAGVGGLGIILYFALHSAPDLALTQLLVETILLVVLACFLAKKTLLTTEITALQKAFYGLAAATTSLVVVSTVVSFLPRPLEDRISTYFSQNSLTLAQGKNIVNVILVDFRGFDTLGEIVVLAITGLGAFILFKVQSQVRGDLKK